RNTSHGCGSSERLLREDHGPDHSHPQDARHAEGDEHRREADTAAEAPEPVLDAHAVGAAYAVAPPVEHARERCAADREAAALQRGELVHGCTAEGRPERHVEGDLHRGEPHREPHGDVSGAERRRVRRRARCGMVQPKQRQLAGEHHDGHRPAPNGEVCRRDHAHGADCTLDGMGALDVFSADTRAWFERSFAAPTPAQEKGWPVIASGRHTLIQAPTGSGKTLAAFLYAIDRLTPKPGAGLRVLYVSPLKALNYDVERNLRGPLAGLRSQLRVAVRTGDTPQKELQAMLRDAPDILITTPESLFLLLTS